MDRVYLNHEPVIITHDNGQSVVLLLLEDFESEPKTARLLRSPAHAGRFSEGGAELESGLSKEA